MTKTAVRRISILLFSLLIAGCDFGASQTHTRESDSFAKTVMQELPLQHRTVIEQFLENLNQGKWGALYSFASVEYSSEIPHAAFTRSLEAPADQEAYLVSFSDYSDFLVTVFKISRKGSDRATDYPVMFWKKEADGSIRYFNIPMSFLGVPPFGKMPSLKSDNK